jgi:hypothetical protein
MEYSDQYSLIDRDKNEIDLCYCVNFLKAVH